MCVSEQVQYVHNDFIICKNVTLPYIKTIADSFNMRNVILCHLDLLLHAQTFFFK